MLPERGSLLQINLGLRSSQVLTVNGGPPKKYPAQGGLSGVSSTEPRMGSGDYRLNAKSANNSCSPVSLMYINFRIHAANSDRKSSKFHEMRIGFPLGLRIPHAEAGSSLIGVTIRESDFDGEPLSPVRVKSAGLTLRQPLPLYPGFWRKTLRVSIAGLCFELWRFVGRASRCGVY